MYRPKLLFIVSLWLATGSFPGLAQNAKTSGTIKLIPGKPSVYITFVKTGPRKPLYVEDGEEGIWLRIHNNTRRKIFILAGGAYPGYGDLSPYYEVESTKEGKTDIPIGQRSVHIVSSTGLASGRSVVFSIPKEHLAKDLRIRISINFDWEDTDDVFAGREVEHFVYFSSADLPKGVVKESD